MSDAFISYRRKPSAPQASLLQEKLKNRHNIDAYLDTTRTDSTKVSFPERLMGAIEEAPTFILMLGDTTLESEWVLKEIQRAYDLKKHCIPIFQESYTPTNSQYPAVNYVLNFDGVHLFDVKNIMIDESVANIVRLIIRQTPIQPEPESMIESHIKIAPNAGVMLGGVMVVLVIMVGIILAILNGTNQPITPASDPTHTVESVALVTDELTPPASETVTMQPINTITIESSPTAQPTQTDSPTNTLSPTLSPEQLALTPVTRNEDWIPYERDFDGVTMVLVPVGSFMMGSTQEQIEDAIILCENTFGGGNCDIVQREKMNGENTIIFEVPFWIDKYEVNQAQFIRLNGTKVNPNYFVGTNLPVENITWFEAKTFCELRGARLPTEAEWEYVARGPSNLIYPWGNEYDTNALNFCDESCEFEWRDRSNSDGYGTTSPAGSYQNGVSWVGVLDLAGNVLEWTNSLSSNYPYNSQDGREVFIDDDVMNIERVLRGASYLNNDFTFRSASRYWGDPTNYANFIGFRCVRDFEG